MHPLELKLKQGAKPVCLRPYPATKTQEVVLKNMMTTLKKIGVFGNFYNFRKHLFSGCIFPFLEEYLLNFYLNECYESETIQEAANWVLNILEYKYEKESLGKTMTEECQNFMVTKQAKVSNLLYN